jgi:hypothetical protein
MLIISTTHFTSLHILSPSLPLTGFHFPNPRFENMRFTVGSAYRPLRYLVPISNGPIHKGVFPDVFSLFSGSDFPIMIDPT